MGGCACCEGLLLCGGDGPRHFAATKIRSVARVQRQNLGEEVRRELRHTTTPQRVEALLRLYEVRGGTQSIEDFYDEVADLGDGGAYGTITRRRAKSSVPGKPAEEVAVKFIAWDRVWHGCWRNPEQEEYVRRELKVLMVLDNPFIVRVLEWFENPRKGIYFVQELCDGGTLQARLDSICELPSKEARMDHYDRLRKSFREMTYALQYLHQMTPPITHCDLKPDNVVYKTKEADSCIKLIDFGLISLESAEENLRGKWNKGTQIFMAPEQYLQVSGAFTTPMDIWALGVIYFWMIAACELGRLEHPAVDKEVGVRFELGFLDLYHAYADWRRESDTDGTPEGDASDVNDEPPRMRRWRSLFAEQATPHAFDLAQRMLALDPTERLHSRDIMQHAWLHEDGVESNTDLLAQESVVMNMRMYPKLNKFEQALLNLVAARITEAGEKAEIAKNLRLTFLSLDYKHGVSGRLHKEDVLHELKAGWGANKSEAELGKLESEITALFEDLCSSRYEAGDGSPWGHSQSPSGSPKYAAVSLPPPLGHRVLSSLEEEAALPREMPAQSQSRCGSGPLPSRSRSGSGGLGSPTNRWGAKTWDVDLAPSHFIGLDDESSRRDTISYTEFIACTIGSQILSLEEYLFSAYSNLRSSSSGAVTRADLEGALGLEAADRLLFELEKESMTYEDFKVLAKRVAQKRWGIVPLDAESGAEGTSPRSPLERTGIRPLKTLSGQSFTNSWSLLRRRLSSGRASSFIEAVAGSEPR